MVSVLMIDDDTELANTVELTLQEEIDSLEFSSCNFPDASEHLKRLNPDVVVLDIFRGNPADQDAAGQHHWASVWSDENRFCPIIVYTAGHEELAPRVPENHPFVKYLVKGTGTDRTLAGMVNDFRPHVEAIRSANNHVALIVNQVLRDVSQPIFELEAENREELLVRTARRRLAATIDELTLNGERGLKPWERYIFPAIGDSLLLGDVLAKNSEDLTLAESYRVVLSPSCDIQNGRIKVTNVLTARATTAVEYITKGLDCELTTGGTKVRKKISLNDAQQGGFFILPSFSGKIPLLAVNTKDLELIPPTEIGNSIEPEKSYHRVASIDSPFREQISWAFIQIAGRPGMPNCNHDSTIGEIMSEFEAAKDNKN